MPDVLVTDCGALGDGSGRKVTAGDLSALHPIGQHYQPGIDTVDFVGCQEGIYRAFGPPGNENGAGYRRNKKLKFPGGEYILNRPLELRYVQGGTIEGDGEFATTLSGTNKSGGAPSTWPSSRWKSNSVKARFYVSARKPWRRFR